MDKKIQKQIVDTVNKILNEQAASSGSSIGEPILDKIARENKTKKRTNNSILNPDIYNLPYPFGPPETGAIPEVQDFLTRQEDEMARRYLEKTIPQTKRDAMKMAQAAMVDQPHGQYEGPEDEAPWNKKSDNQKDAENIPFRLAPESNPDRYVVDIMTDRSERNLPKSMKPFFGMTWKDIINASNKQSEDETIQINPDEENTAEIQIPGLVITPGPAGGPGIFGDDIEIRKGVQQAYQKEAEKSSLPFPSVAGVDPFESPHGYEPTENIPTKDTNIQKPKKEIKWTGSPSPYSPVSGEEPTYSPLIDPKERADRIASDIELENRSKQLEKEKQTTSPENMQRIERSAKRLGVEPFTPEHQDAVKKDIDKLKNDIAKYKGQSTSSSPVMITKMNTSGEYELVPADLSKEEDLRRIQPGSESYGKLSPEDKKRRDALQESSKTIESYCHFISEAKRKSAGTPKKKNKEPLQQVSVSEPVKMKPGTQWAAPEGYKGKIIIKNIKPEDTGLFSEPQKEQPAPEKKQPITSPSKLKKLGIAAALVGGIATGSIITHLAAKKDSASDQKFTYNTTTNQFEKKDMKSLKEYQQILSDKLNYLEEAKHSQQKRGEARAQSMGFNLGSGHPRSRGAVNVAAIRPERLGPHLKSIVSAGGGEKTFSTETETAPSQEGAKQPGWGERLKPHIITLMGAAQEHKIELSKEEAVSAQSADRKRLLGKYQPGSDVHKAAHAVDQIMRDVRRA